MGQISTANAECGSYVTIGNKAKLKELQDAGYLPKKMAGHESRQKSGAESKLLEDHGDLAINKEILPGSLPTLPCSGPLCRSGKRSNPSSPAVPPAPITVKSGLSTSLGKRMGHNCATFVGFVSFDETPVVTITCLDRPPE